MIKPNRYNLYVAVVLVLLGAIPVLLLLARRHVAGLRDESRTAAQGGSTAQGWARTFRLKEVSAFDLAENAWEFAEGQGAMVRRTPIQTSRCIPPSPRRRRLYGRVIFADPLVRPDPHATYQLALDESKGTGQGYDRLYFDLNQDGDLTNDKVLTPQRNPPEGAALDYATTAQQTCFENFAVPLSSGSQGQRPLEIMPRLLIWQGGYQTLSFVTTKARRGRIRLAGVKCDILLGHNRIIAGWFDHPWTALHVIPAGNKARLRWTSSDQLIALHKISGNFYQFLPTPAGDRLTVRPYAGPLGVFEAGAGGRSIEGVNVRGSLRSRDTIVPVGEIARNYHLSPIQTPVPTCQVPAGDYLPEDLTVQFGKLRVNLSNNYHSDGKRRDIMSHNRPWVYGIQVRPDKPFVLDFSNHPAVLFASPARDQRLKRGEEVSVMAVLIDPVQDFMIRHLDDTTPRQAQVSDRPDGALYRSEEDVSLAPKVTITRANGEIVAEGVMPFG